MKKNLVCVAFLLLIVLSACSGQQQAQIQPTLIAMVTPSLVTTSLLTEKPMLMPTPSRTFEPVFLTAEADLEAGMIKKEATNAYFQTFCGNGLFLDWGDIPSDLTDWRIVHCHASDFSKRYAEVIQADPRKVWTIALDNKDLFLLRDKFDISLRVERRSKDGQYLYLFPSYQLKNGFIDGWSPDMIFEYTTGFYRLNLETGDFEAILNPNSISGLEFSYTLSPDERYLAFANELDKNAFYIRDMRTGLDKRFELNSKIENVGDFVWTPDSKRVVFAAALNGWYDKKAGTSLYIFDTQTSSINVLLYNDREQRVPSLEWDIKSYWLRENILYLISAQDGYTDWSLDIRSGFIAPVPTQTPWPSNTPLPTQTTS
jgi:hypothetical protein